MRILIVDDEDNIRFVLKYNLELDGHTILEARNGEEALNLVKEKPDAILLDVMMPVMNGLEVCQTLKGNPDTKETPIIMLTAKSQLIDIEDAFRAGADDYLTKPFEPDEISAKIEAKVEKILKARSE